jgi:hypothetical protein
MFETFNASGNVDLFLTRGVCLTNFTTYDPALAAYPYASANPGTVGEFLCIGTNRSPVGLSAGLWYLAVVNREPSNSVTYCVRATQLYATNFTRVTNSQAQCRTVAAGNGIDYFIVPVAPETVLALFELSNTSGNGNVDLFVSRDACVTNFAAFDPAQAAYPYASVNPGSAPECISVGTDTVPVGLSAGDWYVAVVNRSGVAVDYCLLATQFTNNAYVPLMDGVGVCGERVRPDNGAGGIGVNYYTFEVGSNVLEATFEVFGASGNVDLYVEYGLCFRNRDTFSLGTSNASYASTNAGVSAESLCIERGSKPVGLREGTWYLAVVNREGVDVDYCVRARTLQSGDVVSLTNGQGFTVSGPLGVGRVDYFRYAVSSNAVQVNFEVLAPTANVDLYVDKGFCSTNLATFTYASTNGSTNAELIVVATNTAPKPLVSGDWLLAVENLGVGLVTYTVRVTEILDWQIIRLSNGVAYSNTVAGLGTLTSWPYQYYVYRVTTNAERAQFEVLGPDGDVNLYGRLELPVPTPVNGSLHSINGGSSEELIKVSRSSAPVPLQAGEWFLGVYNNTSNAVSYAVQASEFDSAGTNVAVTRAYVVSNLLCITWTNLLPGVNYYVVGKATFTATAWLPLSPTLRASGTWLTWCTELPTAYGFFDLREGLSPLSLDNPTTFTNQVFGASGLTLCWTGPPDQVYGVYYADQLWPPDWKPYPDVITSTNTLYKFIDDGSKTGGLNLNRFYRVILLSTP